MGSPQKTAAMAERSGSFYNPSVGSLWSPTRAVIGLWAPTLGQGDPRRRASEARQKRLASSGGLEALGWSLWVISLRGQITRSLSRKEIYK